MKRLGEEESKELIKRFQVNELSILFIQNKFNYQVEDGVVHLTVGEEN